MYQDSLKTPVGLIMLYADNDGLTGVYYNHENTGTKKNKHTNAAKNQLKEYFSGERSTFDLTLNPQGTEFQKSVWQALLDVAYGKTCSYQDIANSINNPKSVRAVGLANGKNPISIIVPCHRIIGSNGTLTGYAGGLDKKAWLLKHEGAMLL